MITIVTLLLTDVCPQAPLRAPQVPGCCFAQPERAEPRGRPYKASFKGSFKGAILGYYKGSFKGTIRVPLKVPIRVLYKSSF